MWLLNNILNISFQVLRSNLEKHLRDDEDTHTRNVISKLQLTEKTLQVTKNKLKQYEEIFGKIT